MEVNRKITGLKTTILMEQHKYVFTKSDHRIHDYILANMDKVLYYSLTELSDAIGVAEATVLRFFRKLEFKGFQDFKLSLAKEIYENSNQDSDETYIERIRSNMVYAIEDTYNMLDEQALENSIDAIVRSRDVAIFGIGSSGIAVVDMQNRLMRIGKHVDAVTDSHFQVMRATSLTEDSVVIAISLTGSTKDIVHTVKIAKEKKATVIVLTNYIKSPLAKYSDYILLTSVKESPLDSGSLVAKITQLYLIDLICTGIIIRNYDQASKAKMEISENVSKKLY